MKKLTMKKAFSEESRQVDKALKEMFEVSLGIHGSKLIKAMDETFERMFQDGVEAALVLVEADEPDLKTIRKLKKKG